MNTLYNTEGRILACEGAQLALVCSYQGNPTITSPTVKVYKGTADVTTDIIPSGSASVVGSTVVLPTIIIPTSPAREYVVVVTANLDGLPDPRKISIQCEKKEQGFA